MDKTTLDILEFNNLLNIISDFSLSEASRKAVLEIVPFKSRDDILTRQRHIREIVKMSHEGTPLRLSHFPEISHLLLKVRPEGAVLEAHELAGFMPVLNISSDISMQVRERDDLPSLRELSAGLTGFPDILRILKRSVDSEGNILDSASSQLAELREQIRRLESRIIKKLEELVRDEKISLFLQDDFITKRSGRWVIPVRMDSKGQVAGVVHDVSKSGETAFIEPLTIINLANELENLNAEQKAEEIRILKKISSRIREAAGDIVSEYKIIILLDLLNCVAKFSDSLEMEIPSINDSGIIGLSKARHPLLYLALRKFGGRQVVPLDVDLGGDATVMVITGSNAGGKTIAIKTIGLLSLMALSGMPVPADSSSTFPLVETLLVDIGDEQSIENNLSTFSAHVSNISGILKRAGSKSLVLIDELGTGTDPDEGAALACAVLKELKKSRALVFATTHLADIKGFVHRSEGMLNASMEFDQKTLSPLYRLRIGEPGQSHAIETAKRYGLPDSVIDSARAMLGGIKVEFDNLISDLNQKRADYEKALEAVIKKKSEMDEKDKRLDRRLAEADERSKEMLSNAYKEASEIIFDMKRRMYALLEELKKKERTGRREVVRNVEAEQKRVTEKLREFDLDDGGTPPIDEIKEDDEVFVRSLGYDARVVKVIKAHNRLRVRTGGMEVELPLSEIGFKRGKAPESGAARTKTIVPRDETAASRINLIGLRVDDALSRLEPFLNHASLAGLTKVAVIHGLGAGILSRAIREHLEGHPLVKKYRSGDRSEGGAGVTVITMA